MSRFIELNQDLYEYILSISPKEEEVLKRLRQETLGLEESGMQIGRDQGNLMRLLVELMKAKRILEIGVFTGYSTLSVALGLPEDGVIIACDKSKIWTDIARKYWEEAGVSQKIDLRLGEADETLKVLREEQRNGVRLEFDFVFIDADKANYELYFEESFKLLRRGGLIVVDNVLWSGRVIDKEDKSESTEKIRLFNEKLCGDDGIEVSVLSIGDGLTLAMKK